MAKKLKKVNFASDAYLKIIHDEDAGSLVFTNFMGQPLEVPLGSGGGQPTNITGDANISVNQSGYNASISLNQQLVQIAGIQSPNNGNTNITISDDMLSFNMLGQGGEFLNYFMGPGEGIYGTYQSPQGEASLNLNAYGMYITDMNDNQYYLNYGKTAPTSQNPAITWEDNAKLISSLDYDSSTGVLTLAIDSSYSPYTTTFSTTIPIGGSGQPTNVSSTDGSVAVSQNGYNVDLSVSSYVQSSIAALDTGVNKLNSLEGSINIVSPDSSVGIQVSGQQIQLSVDSSIGGDTVQSLTFNNTMDELVLVTNQSSFRTTIPLVDMHDDGLSINNANATLSSLSNCIHTTYNNLNTINATYEFTCNSDITDNSTYLTFNTEVNLLNPIIRVGDITTSGSATEVILYQISANSYSLYGCQRGHTYGGNLTFSYDSNIEGDNS